MIERSAPTDIDKRVESNRETDKIAAYCLGKTRKLSSLLPFKIQFESQRFGSLSASLTSIGRQPVMIFIFVSLNDGFILSLYYRFTMSCWSGCRHNEVSYLMHIVANAIKWWIGNTSLLIRRCRSEKKKLRLCRLEPRQVESFRKTVQPLVKKKNAEPSRPD